MNIDNTPYASDNKHSTISLTLSLTCTLILLAILVRSSESSSLLLHATLAVWLVHMTFNQVCKSLDVRVSITDLLRSSKPEASGVDSAVRNFSDLYDQEKVESTPTTEWTDISETRVVRKTAWLMARSLVYTGTKLMSIAGVRDNSLSEEKRPSRFYQECWNEDIELRTKASKQVAFGFKCFAESLVFVIHDGYVSRNIQSAGKKLFRFVYNKLVKVL